MDQGEIAMNLVDGKLFIRKSDDSIIDLTDWANLHSIPSTFPPDAHVHDIVDITNLQTELDGKEPADPAIQSHIATVTGNPHAVTASDVGLGNVDNTSDLDKPISTATQTALDLKSDVGHDHGGAIHTHTNLSLLELLSDIDGALAYDGVLVVALIDGGTVIAVNDFAFTTSVPTAGNNFTF